MKTNMKFEFVGGRVDATGFNTEAQAAAELESVTRIPLQGGKVAVIVKPWDVQVSTFNPHGYGVPAHRVYAVARYVVVASEHEHDTGEILVTYRRQLRELKTIRNVDLRWVESELARISPVIFGLGRGFDN
jgi:hypothetical protein